MNSQASYALDLSDLYRKDDKILPDNTSNALHVAAALGLPNFTREIIDRSPDLAFGFDERGLTPCHLAVANGRLSVVKELMDSKVGLDVCFLRDRGEFLTVHTAVMKGRVDVLKEVGETCPLSILREPTCLGDSILHLALKFDSLSAFNHFARMFRGDYELFNRKDADGNTILHLAVARRQLQVVKTLLGHTNKDAQVEVNAANTNGSTALDIFFDSGNEEHGDTTLEEVIRSAGGRRGVELKAPQPRKMDLNQLELGEPKTEPPPRSLFVSLRQRFFAVRIAISRRVSSDKDKEMGNALMVVATLIATITFQGALNPPGGVFQDGPNVGKAVKESSLGDFLFFDMMALVASVSVILQTIYIVPRWKDMIKLSIFLLWISVFFTMWSFLAAIPIIFPKLSANPWIISISTLGDVVVQLFALFLFCLSWYFLHKRCPLFLHKIISSRGIEPGLKRILMIFLPILGASMLWVPWISIDLLNFFLPTLTVYPSFFVLPYQANSNVTMQE